MRETCRAEIRDEVGTEAVVPRASVDYSLQILDKRKITLWSKFLLKTVNYQIIRSKKKSINGTIIFPLWYLESIKTKTKTKPQKSQVNRAG